MRFKTYEIPDFKPGQRIQILRGKKKGYIYTVHQSANDWVTVVDHTEGKAKVFSKRSVRLLIGKNGSH